MQCKIIIGKIVHAQFIINSTTCNQGSVPILAVNATLPEHVQATLQFANTYNLRLVMKTTGHDYLGRSTAFGSLLLWLHYMKNMTLIDNFPLCTGENISNAIRLGAGVQWGEVYNWLAPYNLTAIGGASGTVGASWWLFARRWSWSIDTMERFSC